MIREQEQSRADAEAENEWLEKERHKINGVLDSVITETESSLSARDFSPADVRCEASWDMATPRGQIKWIKAQNQLHGDLIDRSEFIGNVVDWVCWQKDVVRMDGSEEKNAWVACIMFDDGTSVSTASSLTVKQWSNIARALRSGMLRLPLRCRFVPNASKIKGGNPWFSIVPVEE